METNKITWGLNTYEFYSIKPNYKTLSLSLGMRSLSFLIPDLGIFLILGGAIISPIGFKKGLLYKIDKIKEKAFIIKYRYLTRWP